VDEADGGVEVKVTEMLDKMNVKYVKGGEHKHVRVGWVGVDCPWCGRGTEKYHMGIPEAGQCGVCWKCGYKGIGEVVRALGGSVREWIAQVKGGRVTRREERVRGELKVPVGVGELEEAHRRYLEGRGYDVEEVERWWGVKGIGVLGGRLRWRLWIPVRTKTGEVGSWTTRAVGGQEPRYVSATGREERVGLKTMLYGEEYCWGHGVVVCEGPLDVWKVGLGAVAVFGLQMTREQAERLARYRRRVIVFDMERSAQRAAKRLKTLLCDAGGKTIWLEVDAKDAGAETEEVLKWAREWAGLD